MMLYLVDLLLVVIITLLVFKLQLGRYMHKDGITLCCKNCGYTRKVYICWLNQSYSYLYYGHYYQYAHWEKFSCKCDIVTNLIFTSVLYSQKFDVLQFECYSMIYTEWLDFETQPKTKWSVGL